MNLFLLFLNVIGVFYCFGYILQSHLKNRTKSVVLGLVGLMFTLSAVCLLIPKFLIN